MPSWPGVFQFGTIFSVALNKSKSIFTLGLSSSPDSFSMSLIHSAFFVCSLRSHILLQNCFVSLSSAWWRIFVHSSSTYWYNFFRYFGFPCFVCIVLSCLDTFLFFFLCPLPSGLFPRVVLYILLELLFFFSSQHIPVFHLYLKIIACCRRFLMFVSCWISHQGFEFLFLFLMGTSILSQTNFAPA